MATGLERIAAGRPGGFDAAFERPEYLKKVKQSFDRQNRPGLMRLDGTKNPAESLALIME